MDPSKQLRIGCYIMHHQAYGRDVLHGVLDWQKTQVGCRVVNHHHLERVIRFKPHGIIAQVAHKSGLPILRGLNVPILNISASLKDIPFPTITADNEAVGHAGAAHLIENGVRCLAFARSPWTHFSTLREQGFHRCARERGVMILPTYNQDKHLEAENPRGLPYAPSLLNWVRQLPPGCGVMTDFEELATDILEVALDEDLRVPDDIAVISADQEHGFAEMSDPPLSCVPMPGLAVGWQAAECMANHLLKGVPLPEVQVLIPPGQVIARQSSDLLHVEDLALRAALLFIREHAHQPINVSQVVAASGINRRALELKFRNLLKRSIREEIELEHLVVAKRLLEQTRLPMGEVAEQSGFTSVHRMTCLIKEDTGMTPLVYRKNLAPN
ncbi:MAG: substrate-binding domain-containing protein [Verrucomicrobia bacterium]|nr:substrate-binding domain-containing protein [Verrucomicrobiota bacterium]MCH8513980.1 substrate-binding domain-containing protein [Kiritimatiellia bacterium]